MSKTLNPYLSFDGNAREAMEFYQAALGGDLVVKTHGEVTGDAAGPMADKVMHARLLFDSGVLMASDIPSDRYTKPTPMVQMSINTESVQETEELFSKMSEGGSIFMPPQKTFWAECFAMFADKYGVSWMLNYEQNPTV